MVVSKRLSSEDFLGECLLCGEDLYEGWDDTEVSSVTTDGNPYCYGEDTLHAVPYDGKVTPTVHWKSGKDVS